MIHSPNAFSILLNHSISLMDFSPLGEITLKLHLSFSKWHFDPYHHKGQSVGEAKSNYHIFHLPSLLPRFFFFSSLFSFLLFIKNKNNKNISFFSFLIFFLFIYNNKNKILFLSLVSFHFIFILIFAFIFIFNSFSQ